MKKNITTNYTDQEFRQLIREELRSVLTGEDHLTKSSVEEDFIDIKQAAEFLKLKTGSIYNYINKGVIPFHKKPGSKRVLFKKQELREWMKKSKE